MGITDFILIIGFFMVTLVLGQGIDKINHNLESIKNLIEFYGRKQDGR